MASLPCDFYFNLPVRDMHPHESVIGTFYSAFANADAEAMIACYHTDIRFEDPVFGVLHGVHAKDMWRMLVRPGIRITCSDIVADDHRGSATWIAAYHFGKSHRPVVNHIKAQFVFKEGKIIQHIDRFDLWKWSRQALGLPGALFGWTPWMQRKIRNQVRNGLRSFQQSLRV
jgi:hypothetical protein